MALFNLAAKEFANREFVKIILGYMINTFKNFFS